MSLNPGSRLGPYEILAPLGAGGMGEVFRARDSRLSREVAVKALPDEFARDPERLARFEREARLLASLTHPHIAGIHGLEEVDGHRYLILEFVEGETLAHRLDRGALTLDEALRAGAQIAAALEAAHESGVVHRDLKPGNVMITPAGDAKVLDFGLAKGTGSGAASGSGASLSHSPTLTHQATGAGVILGTAAYMSPEQARGRSVDKRADIWSFGCVLYECLAGRQTFSGDTVSDLIARILEREPDWDQLPARTPPRIRDLLRRCLEKDVRRRLRDIGDARIEIEDVIATKSSSPSAIPAARAPRVALRTWLGGAALVAMGALATYLAMPVFAPAPTAPVTRFEIPEEPGTRLEIDGAAPSISPDGRTLAFRAADSTGTWRLWVRSLESLTAREIPGTDGAVLTFWSPDSKHIGFFSDDARLMKVAASGGTPETITATPSPRGATWNRADIILLAPVSEGVIHRVSANGGDAVPVTTLDSTETAHRFPHFLPDGKRFLYTALPPRNGRFRIYLASLDGGERTLVLEAAGTGVVYAHPGYLIYQRDDVLVAHAFDTKQGRVVGEPVSLRDYPVGTSYSGSPAATASASGTLAYTTKGRFATHLQWADMTGSPIQSIPVPPGRYINIELSPDGRQALLQRNQRIAVSDLWVADLERGVVTRLPTEATSNETAFWSPDGTHVAFSSGNYGHAPAIVVADLTSTAATRVYLENDPAFKWVCSWTPDGRALVYGRQESATRRDLWILPLEGDSTPQPYLVTPYFEVNAFVSPDGRWMVYDSDESGVEQVYVQSFPVAGAKYQVTTRGGFNQRWSRDGRMLYFGQIDDPLATYGADVLPGPQFRLGPPRLVARHPDTVFDTELDDRNGRVLQLVHVGPLTPLTITIVQNWPSLLSSR